MSKKKNKKRLKRITVLSLLGMPFFLFILFIFLLLGSGTLGSDGSSSSSGTGGTSLTPEEISERGKVSLEVAKNVKDILNALIVDNQANLEGASGALAVAERESMFDPKAVNPSGGVAGVFQWSGWSSTINGDRWSKASSRKLEMSIQMELMKTELQGSYSHVGEYIKTAKSPEEATAYWSKHYEGVSLDDPQTKPEQIKANARKWYEVFKGTLMESGGEVSGGAPTGATLEAVPKGFNLKNTWNGKNYNVSGSYPAGQCTWYVYNRGAQLGIKYSDYMGNGGAWGSVSGYKSSHVPKIHTAISFAKGQAGADATYGHVGFVEAINSDGTMLISEMNVRGFMQVTYRVFSKAESQQFTYVEGN